jgi:hypothetical protein
MPKVSLLYLTLINVTIKTWIPTPNNKKPGTTKKGFIDSQYLKLKNYLK